MKEESALEVGDVEDGAPISRPDEPVERHPPDPKPTERRPYVPLSNSNVGRGFSFSTGFTTSNLHPYKVDASWSSASDSNVGKVKKNKRSKKRSRR